YWGPNLARNFGDLAELSWLCDVSEEKRAEFSSRYPDARVTGDFDAMLADDDLDAIVVATPVPTHHELAKRALEAGKHVLVEEPDEAMAHGRDFLTEGVEDVVFCYLRFPSGKIAHMHLSWLDPHKMRKITVVGREKVMRKITVVGREKMVVFDDMELERKV